jgi:hypothetical protein
MNLIDLNIEGNIVKIVYNDLAQRYVRYSKNTQTGMYVALLLDGGIEVNLTGESTELHFYMFNEVNNVPVANNEELFFLLETFL